MNVSLTARQEAIVEAVRRHVGDHGYAPTLREIAKATGTKSISTVAYNLKALAALDVLTVDIATPRSIQLQGDRCPHCNGTGVTS